MKRIPLPSLVLVGILLIAGCEKTHDPLVGADSENGPSVSLERPSATVTLALQNLTGEDMVDLNLKFIASANIDSVWGVENLYYGDNDGRTWFVSSYPDVIPQGSTVFVKVTGANNKRPKLQTWYWFNFSSGNGPVKHGCHARDGCTSN